MCVCVCVCVCVCGVCVVYVKHAFGLKESNKVNIFGSMDVFVGWL